MSDASALRTDGVARPLRSRLSSAVGLPVYPIIVAATYVLNLWVESGVSVFAVVRPLLVAVVGCTVLVTLLAALTRRMHVAGAMSLLLVALLITRGAAYVAAVAILSVVIPLAFLMWARIRKGTYGWPEATRALNVATGLLLLVSLVGGIPRGSFAALATDFDQGDPTLDGDARGSIDAEGAPDIYILLLDGYPRSDSFERLFGGDNEDFLDGLRRRGFAVMDRSESNYPMTQGTLTSMFHMRPLHEIAALQPLIDGTEDPYPLLRLALNDNPAFDLLRSKGYRIVTSNPGYEHVALRAADVFFDNGALNEVERQLIRFTPIHRLVDAISPSALAGQHRERILANFTFFVDAARAEGPPTMAFIHIPSPHLPVVVDSNGEVLAEPPGDEEYAQVPFSNEARATYRGQIDFLEETVLESMDAVLSGRQGGMEPIIILMSDHGAAPPALVRAGIATDDHYENLFAVRMPDGADIYPADITLVNLFPILFNHLFDIDAPLWPNDRFPWQGFGGDVGQ